MTTMMTSTSQPLATSSEATASLPTETIEHESPELDTSGPDDGDTSSSEGDGDDDGERRLYEYVALYKNGHVTNHMDERTPAEIAFDHRMALLYPVLPKSYMTEAEMDRWEDLARQDPKRYQRKDAKAYIFVIGYGTGDSDEGDDLESLDPREIQALVQAESFGPPPPSFDDDDDQDDEDDDDQPSGPRLQRSVAKINGAPPSSRGGRSGLRDRLGR
jgi:hypothetical protein